MKKYALFVLFCFISSLICFHAKADENKNEIVNDSLRSMIHEPSLKPNYDLATFRLNVLYATYFTGEVGSGTVAWTPGVQFNHDWGTRVLVGVSLLKDANRDQPTSFLAPEIQLLTHYRVFSSFILELGGGLQKWLVLDGSTYPILTVNTHYSFDGLLGPIDSLFIGYSAVWEIITNNQIRIGLQIKL